MKVVKICEDIFEARQKEQFFIDLFYGRDCCYNQSKYADKTAAGDSKYEYSVYPAHPNKRKYKTWDGSLAIFTGGTWLSIHAASKSMRISKNFLKANFDAALKSGGDLVVGDLHFRVRVSEPSNWHHFHGQ